MAIKRWDPFIDFLDVQNEFNEIFRKTFGIDHSAQKQKRASIGRWAPRVDIYEDKDHFVVETEIPGLKREDINISIDGENLEIKGERKFTEKIDEENYHRLERRYGLFERIISLPEYVNKETVKAKYEDGLLKVNIPKLEKEKPKKIKVEIENKKSKKS